MGMDIMRRIIPGICRLEKHTKGLAYGSGIVTARVLPNDGKQRLCAPAPLAPVTKSSMSSGRAANGTSVSAVRGRKIPAWVEQRRMRKGTHWFLRQFEQGVLYLCWAITALM